VLMSQRPRNSGSRFSTNARMPSLAFSVLKQMLWAAVSASSADSGRDRRWRRASAWPGGSPTGRPRRGKARLLAAAHSAPERVDVLRTRRRHAGPDSHVLATGERLSWSWVTPGARREAAAAPSWRAVVAVRAEGPASEPCSPLLAAGRAPSGGWGARSEPGPERVTATGEPCWRGRGLAPRPRGHPVPRGVLQRPRNSGSRFSTNARMPSRASSVSKQMFWAAVSASSADFRSRSALV